MATKKAVAQKTDDKAVKTSPHIIGPRVTEKAAYATEKNVYVFNVAKNANKTEIKKAIKSMYNVAPIAVNVVVSKPKSKNFRGTKGTQKGFKKAYVTLKKGDTIEIN